MKEIVWLLAFVGRAVLMVLGWVLVPFLLNRKTWWTVPETTPEGTAWERYVWSAWRNPVEGLDHLIKQPVPEVQPNPDFNVRKGLKDKDTRYMKEGIFWEYWSLSEIRRGPWKGRYWEFRIGWKFVDGNDDFVPTFQLGPKK